MKDDYFYSPDTVFLLCTLLSKKIKGLSYAALMQCAKTLCDSYVDMTIVEADTISRRNNSLIPVQEGIVCLFLHLHQR